MGKMMHRLTIERKGSDNIQIIQRIVFVKLGWIRKEINLKIEMVQ